MENIIAQSGFRSVEDFAVKVVLPTLVVTVGVFLGAMLFLPLPIWAPYILLLVGFSFIFIIPVLMSEQKKIDVQENIHLFITYAGTIATIDLDRTTFFNKISENKDYGYISSIFKKARYLAKEWNLGYAYTCRKLAKFSSSKMFADFLDRFAAALDFGQPLSSFLMDEQAAVFDDFSTEYKESLNNIGMLREAFIAITISIAFGISTALLLPLMMGISIVVAIRWSLFGLFVIDILMFILIKAIIPSDDLIHSLKIKSRGTKRIYMSIAFVMPVTLSLLVILFYYGTFSFLTNVAISSLPLMIIGYFAVREENTVFLRDKAFPAFIRALGATIYARQGGILSSVEALQVHDFGILQEIVANLYKRLKIRSEKIKSWMYFAGETGSKLISRFINIFTESIYLGGNAQKIGEIISENFQKLISLRKLRQQQASALKGALYGSMVGFIATIYISVSITQLLTEMFSSAWGANAGQSNISGLVSSIIPVLPETETSTVSFYIGLIVIFHSFVSSLILKVVDGGSKFAMFFDFNAMVWIGTIMSWVVPKFAYKLFSGSIA